MKMQRSESFFILFYFLLDVVRENLLEKMILELGLKR